MKNMTRAQKVLDIGCGNNKIAGATGMDIDPATQADIVWDLNTIPYPVEDGAYDMIYAKHIIEHVADPVAFVREIYRITRPGGACFIETPHFSSYVAYSEPQHKRYCSYFMIDEILKKVNFRIRKRAITFYKSFRFCGIQYLANRAPRDYERFWTYIFPAENITITLEKPA